MRTSVDAAGRLPRALAAACALVLAASAAPAPASTTRPPAADPAHRVQLRDLACHPALDPPDRSVSVTAIMRPLSTPEHLSLRATLQRRRGHGKFRSLHGGALGPWITPKDTTLGRRRRDMWIVNLPVHDLVAPATYRFAVTFRWSDARGRRVARTQLLSELCKQPELRPDLAIVAPVQVTPDMTSDGTPTGMDRYAVKVRNRGRSAAGPFDVILGDGGQVSTQTVERLNPAQSTVVRFIGPACSADAPPQVTADPQKQVDDFNRSNNTVTVSCDASGTSG